MAKRRLLIAGQPQTAEKEDLYALVQGELNRKKNYELDRLLYVAATRARDRLFLLGNVVPKKDGSDYAGPKPGTFLKLLWPEAEPVFRAAWESRQQAAAPAALAIPAANAVPLLRRLPDAWKLPVPAPAVAWTPPYRSAVASARQLSYEWVGDAARRVGTVIHEYLRLMGDEGIEAWSVARVAAQVARIELDLQQVGLTQQESKDGAAQVARALTNTLNSERGRWVLAARPDAVSEWALSGAVGGLLYNVTVDRTFRDENGRRWIIDFKTGEHSGGSLERFLAEEQRRHRDQLERYAAVLRQQEPGPIVLGLYFPMMDAWREWAFTEERIAEA